MQPRATADIPPDLDAFLTANLGLILDADTGPWLGQAALAFEAGDAPQYTPAGCQDAVNLALAG